MKSLFIVCAAVACTIAASGCSGEGPPATIPIDPFGIEPAPTTGTEPTGGGQATIAELCSQVCGRLAGACGSSGDTGCASECAADSSPNCEAEFRAFLECVTTAPLVCNGGFIAPTCESAFIVFGNCANSTPTGQ